MPDATDTATSPADRLADLNRQLIAAQREQIDAANAMNHLLSDLPRDPDPNENPEALYARRRAADARITHLRAQIAQARADAREALESDSAELLAELGDDLTASRDRLAAAAKGVQDALAGLLAAAAGYQRQIDVTRDRLGRAGFDSMARNQLIAAGLGSAERFPTHDSRTHLHIRGVAWPVLSPVAPVAWAIQQAAATGTCGPALTRLAGTPAGADARTLDALIAEQARP